MASTLLTREMCADSWELLLPTIKTFADAGVVNKFAGTIVVIDPTRVYYESSHLGDGVVFVADIDPDHKKADLYHKFALDKAHEALRTGLSGRELVQRPWLYCEPLNPTSTQLGDDGGLKYAGSVVREGLITAFSGVEQEFDEWIAGMMNDLLRACCHAAMQEILTNDEMDYVRSTPVPWSRPPRLAYSR